MDDRFLGTTAVCFVFNFCLFCSHRLPVSERNLPVPKPFFKWISKICFEGQNQNLQKKSCRFKTWIEFVRQILMKLKTSSNEGLLIKVFSYSLMWLSKHCSGHYVTTQACTLISWGCVHLRWCGSLEDYTLWCCIYTSITWVSIGSGNGLSPVRRQAITWINTDLLSIGPLGTNLSEFESRHKTSHSWKCIWKCCLSSCHFAQGAVV